MPSFQSASSRPDHLFSLHFVNLVHLGHVPDPCPLLSAEFVHLDSALTLSDMSSTLSLIRPFLPLSDPDHFVYAYSL
jgi:hypothetical protein